MTYTWLWPGLTRAWLGEWRGLWQAVAFTLLVDALLLATVVWDEVLGSTAAWFGWLSVAVGWVVGAWAGRRRLRAYCRQVESERSSGGSPQATSTAQDLFPEALNEYLQGNWLVAEEKCRELIRRRRDDVEARLLLATLLRHTERSDEARQALDELEKFDGAARWEMEIEFERRLLDEAEAESEADLDEAADDEPAEEGAGEGATEDGVESTGGVRSDLPTRRAA